MTIVHLLRHGEVHNPGGILYGREPGYHLSENGKAMAQVVAAVMSDRDVTHIRYSPLERAVETAMPMINAFPKAHVQADERVIETGNLFSGMKLSPNHSGLIRRPDLWKRLRNPFNPSWGESYEEMAGRVMKAVQSIRKAAGGHEAVIVSHQLPIWATRLHLEGRAGFHDPRKRHADLCSITSLHFDGDRVFRITYSDPIGEILAQRERENAQVQENA